MCARINRETLPVSSVFDSTVMICVFLFYESAALFYEREISRKTGRCHDDDAGTGAVDSGEKVLVTRPEFRPLRARKYARKKLESD